MPHPTLFPRLFELITVKCGDAGRLSFRWRASAGMTAARVTDQLLAARSPSSADAVKIGRRADLDAGTDLCRPHLDGGEHVGTLSAERWGGDVVGALLRCLKQQPSSLVDRNLVHHQSVCGDRRFIVTEQ